MEKINIVIPRTKLPPGDEINGNLFLTSDMPVKCKSFKVVFEGILTAKARKFYTTGKGKQKMKTYTKSFVMHQEVIILGQETEFDPGTTKFEFNFKVPDDARVSYSGYNGSMSYVVAVLMDISWKSKITGKVPITVLQTTYDSDETVIKDVAEHEGKEILELELESQKYCIGSKNTFRYRVNTDMKFNNLRAQVEHLEETQLDGMTPMVHKAVVWEENIPSDDVTRYEWKDWTIRMDKECPQYLLYDELKSILRLKLTICRSYRLDKSVEIALAAIHCPDAIKKLDDESEVEVEPAVPKEKPRPKRLRCNTCSYTFKLKDDDVDFGTCPSCGNLVFF